MAEGGPEACAHHAQPGGLGQLGVVIVLVHLPRWGQGFSYGHVMWPEDLGSWAWQSRVCVHR